MEVKALDTLRKHLAEPEPMETEETAESLRELEEELLKPSKGEDIALWLDMAYSPAFKEKVLEIQRRYTAGEWEGKPVLRGKPEQAKKGLPFTSNGIPPAIAPQYRESESGATESTLYEEGSFLWAMYPPVEASERPPRRAGAGKACGSYRHILRVCSRRGSTSFLILREGGSLSYGTKRH